MPPPPILIAKYGKFARKLGCKIAVASASQICKADNEKLEGPTLIYEPPIFGGRPATQPAYFCRVILLPPLQLSAPSSENIRKSVTFMGRSCAPLHTPPPRYSLLLPGRTTEVNKGNSTGAASLSIALEGSKLRRGDLVYYGLLLYALSVCTHYPNLKLINLKWQ